MIFELLQKIIDSALIQSFQNYLLKIRNALTLSTARAVFVFYGIFFITYFLFFRWFLFSILYGLKGKKKKSGNGAGAVAFGVTYVLLSSIFKIHGLFSLAVQLAVSAFVSAVIRTMAQGLDLTTDDQKKKMAEEAAAEAAKEEEKRKNDALERLKANTGNPDVDQLLNQGREMIAEIRKENDLIPDESLSAKLDDLEALLGKYVPGVEAMRTKLKKYDKTYKELTAENAELEKELNSASRESIQKKLEIQRKLSELDELRRTVDSIPDAVIREYTERKYVHHGRMNQEI